MAPYQIDMLIGFGALVVVMTLLIFMILALVWMAER